MRRLLPLLALPLLLATCSGTEDIDPYKPPGIAGAVTPDSGRDFYLRDCAWCHGSTGGGTARGPNLTTGTNGPAMYHFMLSSGRMPIDDPQQRIDRDPSIYSGAQINAIVAFMHTFDPPGPDIPAVDLEGDVTRGLALYQENCAACHSTTGVGGALTPSRATSGEGPIRPRKPLVAPALYKASPVEVAEAIRAGPGTMPVFGDEAFSEEDVSAIVRYVLYLQDPSDPGGAPIGHVGPVVEGAVGWIVGLGLLVIFIRWIGTKAGQM